MLMLVSANVILWFSHFCLHRHWVHMKLMSSLRPMNTWSFHPGQRLSCSGSSGLVDSETSACGRGASVSAVSTYVTFCQAKNTPRPFWEWCIPLIYIHKLVFLGMVYCCHIIQLIPLWSFSICLRMSRCVHSRVIELGRVSKSSPKNSRLLLQ